MLKLFKYFNYSIFMQTINTSYKILFENNEIIAVDKSGNCPVHPGGIRFKNNSLITQLEKDLKIKLYPIYRIDRETSGIVVFAKKPEIIKNIDIENKTYLAICKGEIKKETIINKPIIQGKGDFMDWKMIVDEKNNKSKEAKTIITPIKTNGDYSLVEAKIITGRRHQIRVHLKSINNEIVGDKIYGKSDKIFKNYIDNELKEPYNRENMNRQALHMHSIEIKYKIDNKRFEKTIKSELPVDMKKLQEII